MSDLTPDQKIVTDAIKDSPELATKLAAILKAVRQDPSALSEHVISDLQEAASALPKRPVSASKETENGPSDDVLAKIREEGFQEGVSGAIMAFGHHLKTLAGGISGNQIKWVFPKDYAAKFTELGIDYKVTPVPQLLEALGETIAFWSMNSAPDEMNISTETLIDSVADIVEISRGFAKSATLAGAYARRDMSNAGSLQGLARNLVDKTQLQLGDLSQWQINKELFVDDSGYGRYPYAQTAANKMNWNQLSGLIRMVTGLITDGTSRFSSEVRDLQPELSISATIVEGNRMKITISSVDAPKATYRTEERDSLAVKIGMNTTQLLTFLGKKFMPELGLVVHEPVVLDGRYSASIEFDRPKWISPPES